MATQKEMRIVREQILNHLQNTEFDGFEYVGLVKDGVLMQELITGAYVVIKPIVKKEDFDPEDALEEFKEALEAKAEREKEKAEKEAKRKAKKAEKEEE